MAGLAGVVCGLASVQGVSAPWAVALFFEAPHGNCSRAGRFFDEADYREAMGIAAGTEIDEQSVKAAQDDAGRLNEGEWMEVTHSEDA